MRGAGEGTPTTVPEIEAELRRLRRKNARLHAEREIRTNATMHSSDERNTRGDRRLVAR